MTTEFASAGGRVVYAVGDIHGRYDLLKQLLGQLAADRRSLSTEQPPMLVFCGDYVDRGPQSAEVLECVLRLKQRPEFEVRLLKGNHEQAMLYFLENPLEGSGWLRFGGLKTLQSYGIEIPDDPDDPDTAVMELRNELRRRLPPSHLALLESLELKVVVGDYVFVHAGIRPGVPLDQQQDHDLMWIRQDFLDAPGPFEKVVVHGHTRTERPQLLGHRMAIDTGAYATGVLTALRLDDEGMAVFDTAA